MNILRVVYEWPPPWIGLTPAPYGLTKAQAKLGHTITVFCGRWPGAGPIEKLSNVTLKTFLREPIRGSMLITIAPLMFLYFLIWRPFHKVDLYHIHGHFGFYIYLYKFLFGFLDKTPVVSHFHICAQARKVEAEKRNVKLRLLTRLIDWPLSILSEKLAVKVGSYLLFVGKNVQSEVVSYYNPPLGKCYVIESAADTDLFRQVTNREKQDIKKELGFAEGDIVISNIGFFVERKNIDVLVSSFASLSESFKLLLVGGTPDTSYKQKLDEIIKTNNLSGRVKFVGEKTHSTLPRYYQGSDIFVLPSSYEGFPKVVVESLACGVPVLASGFDTKSEILGLYKLDDLNPESLATKIKEIVNLRVRVDTEFIAKNYSWDKRALEVESIYNNLYEK